MKPLVQLKECGQSWWLDNLTREKIHSGEIQRLVDEEGLCGITSNPAIFNKAISGSRDYDEQIESIVRKTTDLQELYEGIVVKDIQDACDVLKKVYDESMGVDGFVSLEVSPHLARDTKGTMEEVKRLYNMVNRSNVLIKIPGTKEGIPAIEQMLYEGINVNVTLLFSVVRYEEVAKAYINALTRRKDEGLTIDNIASVASFFLSRIDVLVDQLLHHRITESDEQKNVTVKSLLGKVAIANAKMAYQSFLKIFSGEKWEALAEKGAKVQRPLWASTSTKNPNYRDVMYVEPLIGKDTVNTMPDVTVEAFSDHGKAEADTILQDVEGAEQTLKQLESVGIDIDFVTRQLVNEGIQKFIDPYDKLLDLLKKEMSEALQRTS